MRQEQLIARLQKQLDALLAPPAGYTVEAFQVWTGTHLPPLVGDALVRVEANTWSWGHCQSETCGHHSHDPYQEGSTAYILCRGIGDDEDGNAVYQTPEGRVFRYRYAEDRGSYYAPTARMF